MRKVKHISLVFTLAPLLFVGCTQDKVSRVIPSKSTDNYKQHSLSLTDNTLLAHKQTSKRKGSTQKSELDRLVEAVQLKLAEQKKMAKVVKKEPLQLSKVEKLPLIDDSLIEDIEDEPPSNIIAMNNNLQSFDQTDTYIDTIDQADTYIDTEDKQNEDLTKLMQLVSNNLDTDINGMNGVYTTPIVINDEIDNADDTDKNVKMMDKIKFKKISKEDELIATAIAFLDTKYIWAANGPTAFDCSGFTKYVFKENGVTIPRYSGNQAKVGIKVSYNELKEGDLVFFNTEKKYKKKVNHVGIYMGNNKFIHASSAKKKVVITSFEKKHFYKKRFLWGQRVIKDDATYASL